MARVRPHTDDVAQGLVDPGDGHLIGIDVVEFGTQPAPDSDSPIGFVPWAQDRRVRRPIRRADQWLDHAAPLHFVVVLPDHPFLGRGIEVAQGGP